MRSGPIAAVLAAAAWCPGHAGGIFVNSNQSAEYIRSFDRNSALDAADIAYYNMAGTVCLPPGLTGNLSNQTILQRATVRPLGNPVLGDRTYRSDNPVWLVPNFYLVYRHRRWAGFTALQTIGATAVRRWPSGLPSMDLAGKAAAGYGGPASARIASDAYAAALAAGATQAQAQAAGAGAGLNAAPFPSRSWLKGSSRFLAWRLGAACRISPRWAVAVAGRLVWARQDVSGGVAGACTYDGFADPAPVLIEVSSWLVSLGVNINRIGQRRSATLDTSLPGAHGTYLSLGTGARYQASDRLRLTFGAACTGFAQRYRNADAGDRRLQAAFAANGAAISPDKEYDKRYLILAFGIEYHLAM